MKTINSPGSMRDRKMCVYASTCHCEIYQSESSELMDNTTKDDKKASSDYYFDSYSHFGIHEEMLKDSVRTESYRKAIQLNPGLFKDKIVLDVGCGTGILSMFAARAGAKHVYAVDCASIADQARIIVEANALTDKVTVLRGKIEELELPVESVDIIISEWMGYFLLYESMLDSVIYARDKWLTSDGVLMPDKATIKALAIEDADYMNEKIHFWDDVYGFDMSCIKEIAISEPLVDAVPSRGVISRPTDVFKIDLYTVTKEQLDFETDFQIEFTHNDYCHAVVMYFDVEFSKTKQNVGFCTGPLEKQTHWKQTVFYLDDEVMVARGDVLKGSIKVNRNSNNPRDLDIKLTTHINEKDNERKYWLR